MYVADQIVGSGFSSTELRNKAPKKSKVSDKPDEFEADTVVLHLPHIIKPAHFLDISEIIFLL
ncbi:hypothetical protein VCRA2116O29_140100 [Vibrio crassostreae]|nr:hypothetical protein VCRA2116O29_140100 [Vibrio crassostreae]CAK2414310.1 hypothetical protein VCRA2119O48_160006 [Vibrio crassostreae]CAK3610413.1 hypothetical protein VCRA2123O74_140100 [Vibrio crassostreae]CAK3796523.1 hypothetical protein VCRA212O16_160102 [Vibrio crassostreae]